MTEIIVEFTRDIIRNDYLTIIIIALLPIIELRGAIPVGLGMGMNPFVALMVAYIGSSLVVPILLLLLRPVLDIMKKIKFIGAIAQAMEDMFQSKADKVRQKAQDKDIKADGDLSTRYKLIGVMAFVAVPLPMTGVWTGSAVAAFLNIRFLPALIVILLGNLCAGIIMTLMSVFFIDYLDIIITAFLSMVILVLISYVVTIVLKTKNKA